ncbi:MAG: hypothetical protein OEY60_16830 [Nitrospira sp.]|nr:hypothetical protein [Nitrospira sp.]MDH5727127.1 hypothetical protein [Nitrospira sp.]
METMVKPTGIAALAPNRKLVLEGVCAHGRLIDEVRTRGGKRTGKVRCLECQAVIDDPYQGTK